MTDEQTVLQSLSSSVDSVRVVQSLVIECAAGLMRDHTTVEIIAMEMLIAELHDKVYIEHTYPLAFGSYFPYEKVVLKMKDMPPFSAVTMGEAAEDRHIPYEMFIRQDDHALVLVLLAQGIVILDQISSKIDFKLPGHIVNLPEMEP
jgi:hypothetical protein